MGSVWGWTFARVAGQCFNRSVLATCHCATTYFFNCDTEYFYVFSAHEILPATIFMFWMLAVGMVDNVLKPFLLGRGLDLPIAVVFVGAIGGMIYSGVIGLFVGAVALGYKLFLSWLKE